MKHWFTVVLLVGVVGLSAMALLLVRQNRGLRARIADQDAALQARFQEAGLKPGDRVSGLELFDGAGGAETLAFGAGEGPVLVLLVTSGCDACGAVFPAWDAMVGAGVGGARVVCVDAAAQGGGDLEQHASSFRTLGAADPRWLRGIPVTPAALVVTGEGVVAGVWYGGEEAGRVEEIRAALLEAELDAGLDGEVNGESGGGSGG